MLLPAGLSGFAGAAAVSSDAGLLVVVAALVAAAGFGAGASGLSLALSCAVPVRAAGLPLLSGV